MSNRLINESSPYLLQHAQNPVDWYPWGEEALNKALKEDKPILVSIGYSACHWCHVMEKESFEDEVTAAFMNEHFINIKIDREERPDLDHIYMDAVQAISGSGGWPLNVFLTPDKRPFFGGTYFPPKPAYNRSSWMDVLRSVHQAFTEKRTEMDAQAENLTEHIRRSSEFAMGEGDFHFKATDSNEIARNILQSADKINGGFGKAPKFPQTFSIRYLLRTSDENTRTGDDRELGAESLNQALLSLDKMIEGGIYDQIGGGFARYSTDEEWLAPHFEKMLYDNALLINVLAEAFQLTKEEKYREVIRETVDFIAREMSWEEGGFFSALDADSEGEEGKFYVWSKEEVDELLGKEAEIFCDYYDITSQGNWEHKNILRVNKKLEIFARDKGRSETEISEMIQRGIKKLLEKRSERMRPLTDDKIILGWNALMDSALLKAAAATGDHRYFEMAERNLKFLFTNFKTSEGFKHTWKKNEARYPAFLDDLAFLVAALLDLQESGSDPHWIREAEEITKMIEKEFSDPAGQFFYFTSARQEDVILRKKEIYDGALPSGNSVMAENLLRLGILLDRPEWRSRSASMVAGLAPATLKYPTSFGHWAWVMAGISAGYLEIAVTGEWMPAIRDQILQEYIPHRVLQGSIKDDGNYPLLRNRELSGKTAIWLCRNYTCEAPVFSLSELRTLINSGGKRN